MHMLNKIYNTDPCLKIRADYSVLKAEGWAEQLKLININPPEL